jgi:hypothetical protein
VRNLAMLLGITLGLGSIAPAAQAEEAPVAREEKAERPKPSLARPLAVYGLAATLDEGATRWALARGGWEGNPLMSGGPTGRAAVHALGVASLTVLDVRWQSQGRRKAVRWLRVGRLLYSGVAAGVAIHHGASGR